jgi:hypothetical protein
MARIPASCSRAAPRTSTLARYRCLLMAAALSGCAGAAVEAPPPRKVTLVRPVVQSMPPTAVDASAARVEVPALPTSPSRAAEARADIAQPPAATQSETSAR